MVVTRTWTGLALALIAALSVPMAPSYSASRLADREIGAQWPSVSVPEDGPQWPKVGNTVGKDDTGPQWPNLPPLGKQESPYPGLSLPSMAEQIGLDRDLNTLAGRPTPKDDLDITNSTPRRKSTNRSVMAEPSL